MASKYLSSLSKDEYDNLTEKLLEIQSHKCFICQKEIDSTQIINVDHIVPLANKGKDEESNFAVTHESCNKSKQDADLRIARVLSRLKDIQEKASSNRISASLNEVLADFEGGKYNFSYREEAGNLIYSFNELKDTNVYRTPIYTDNLSGERSCFINLPIEYIHHDQKINPRGLNSSISLLVKEFEKGNPQLHLSLARIENNKVLLFDGQHKAVAQILLGQRNILLRVFITPNVDRLTETNANAGSKLRQIAFDKSIMRQLNNTLYQERVRKYQAEHNLEQDCFDFSEVELVEYFKGVTGNIKKYIIDAIKSGVTYDPSNKLKDYIDFEGKAKTLPISHSTFDKVFLSQYIDSKRVLSSKISEKSDEGLNPRELEISQIVRLMNIIADTIYVDKFDPEIGVYQVEQKIIGRKDSQITDEHLIAYRMSKEEIVYNWNKYIRKIITNYFDTNAISYNDKNLFQTKFDDRLWNNLKNFISNLAALPLWKDRTMADTHFAGKKNYDYWKTIFETSKTPDGVCVLASKIHFVEMQRDKI